MPGTFSKKPTQSDLMMLIVREQPDLKSHEALKEYQRRHKTEVHSSVYYKTLTAFRKELEQKEVSSVSLITEPHAHIHANGNGTPSPAPLVVTTATVEFVPSQLMDTIVDIKTVCDNAGGLDVARQVAMVIDKAGGVANFLTVCDLLKKIVRREGTSSLPADVNARL